MSHATYDGTLADFFDYSSIFGSPQTKWLSYDATWCEINSMMETDFSLC